MRGLAISVVDLQAVSTVFKMDAEQNRTQAAP
jgi:hypothetical protein